jgi:hypothetical protein
MGNTMTNKANRHFSWIVAAPCDVTAQRSPSTTRDGPSSRLIKPDLGMSAFSSICFKGNTV